MSNNNEEDKNSIAYCALSCGDCPVHKWKFANIREQRTENRVQMEWLNPLYLFNISTIELSDVPWHVSTIAFEHMQSMP